MRERIEIEKATIKSKFRTQNLINLEIYHADELPKDCLGQICYFDLPH